MESFIQYLTNRQEADMLSIDPEWNPIRRYDQCVIILGEGIRSLKQYVGMHPLVDAPEEIEYFKRIAPSFYGQYLYFGKLRRLEVQRMSCTGPGFRRHLKKELRKVLAFLRRYHEFCLYYYSGREHLDEKYFTRQNADGWMDNTLPLPDEHLVPASCLVAKILANQQYGTFLEQELKSFELSVEEKPVAHRQWKGSKSDAVEWIVSLFEAKIIYQDGQPATLMQIKEWIETTLQIDLKDFHVLDNRNRARKKETTPFLSSLIEKYNSRADRLLT